MHRRSTGEAQEMHRRCTGDAQEMHRRCTGGAPRRWSEEAQLHSNRAQAKRTPNDGAAVRLRGTTSAGPNCQHAAAPERAAACLPVGHDPTHLVTG